MKLVPLNKKKSDGVEFSQGIVITSWVVTIVWISLSFILAFFDKNTNSDVTVALVTESFGVTLAYFGYQAVLKTSRNKYGVDKKGIPFKLKNKVFNNFPFESEDDSYGYIEEGDYHRK